MFDDDIGGTLDKGAQTASGVGHLVLISVILFLVLMVLFVVIVYFTRKKFLSKSDRKAKVIKLP